MAIDFTATVEGDVLFVKASGFDENLAQVEAFGMAVIEICLAHSVTHVLSDERDLQYRLSTGDTYAAAVQLAEVAPSVARVAIVSDPADIDDALLWENVAVNRGLTVRMFKDPENALVWLKQL
jgi:hypothetical protein